VNVERVENPGAHEAHMHQAAAVGRGGGSDACCHCHHDTVAELTPQALAALIRELMQSQAASE
jgi:hypothetical protein